MDNNKASILKFVLGLKLKQLRMKRGLSLKDLGGLTGLSSSYLNEIEKSKKYPKIDKLIILAKALSTSLEELISSKFDKNLNSLTKYLGNELFQELPLEIFGISPGDLHELMSHSPEKFAAFINTLVEMARGYDLKFEQLLFAALRSYQEMHKNYFPEIEEQALATRKRVIPKSLISETAMDSHSLFSILKNTLRQEFNYSIDEEKLAATPALNSLRTLYKNGSPRTLFINDHLTIEQKNCVLAKELGFCILGLGIRPIMGPEEKLKSFLVALNDFKASSFAGAFLLEAKSLVKDLKSFFNQRVFSKELFLNIQRRSGTGPEVFLHRLTQILPHYFELDQLFFLRFLGNYQQNAYEMTRELHLSQLHNPHALGLSEHYCRRWITVSLIKALEESSPRGVVMGAQKSLFFENKSEYLCLSLAAPLSLNPTKSSCTTLGLLIDERAKKVIKFLSDPHIPRKDVSQTCERCGIQDCEVRAAPPHQFDKQESLRKREMAAREFLQAIP